jgi:secreted trypsin-like serine protease
MYPFAVKFTMTNIPKPDGTTYDSACSGALISARWVRTAGHCFHDVNHNTVSGTPQYKTTATLGKVDLAASGGHLRSVVDVRQSPSNDIALAELDQPVTDIAPAIVQEENPTVGQQLELAGWGATLSTNPTPSTPPQRRHLRRQPIKHTTVDIYGISPMADTSACTYDSGAPHFIPAGGKSGLVVSVESEGPDCPHATPETTSRVDAIASWIYQQIAQTSN